MHAFNVAPDASRAPLYRDLVSKTLRERGIVMLRATGPSQLHYALNLVAEAWRAWVVDDSQRAYSPAADSYRGRHAMHGLGIRSCLLQPARHCMHRALLGRLAPWEA